MNDTVIDSLDDYYRKRIQALQAVDEMVDDIMRWLHDRPHLLENTYVIYTSDNGFHLGQHRLPPGKVCSIEEDIHIPFFIRGPGIEQGKTYPHPTTHTDIVPTLFNLMGMVPDEEFDGELIPLLEKDGSSTKTEHVNVEYWGGGRMEGLYGTVGSDLIQDPVTWTGGSGSFAVPH